MQVSSINSANIYSSNAVSLKTPVSSQMALNSTSFKGILKIQHRDEEFCFDTDKIDRIDVNNKPLFDKGRHKNDERLKHVDGVSIEGETIDGMYTIAYIPYYSINQNEVITAYKSAKSMDEGTVILKTDGSYSGLSVSQWYEVDARNYHDIMKLPAWIFNDLRKIHKFYPIDE